MDARAGKHAHTMCTVPTPRLPEMVGRVSNTGMYPSRMQHARQRDCRTGWRARLDIVSCRAHDGNSWLSSRAATRSYRTLGPVGTIRDQPLIPRRRNVSCRNCSADITADAHINAAPWRARSRQ